jgi:hypothetical protein
MNKTSTTPKIARGPDGIDQPGRSMGAVPEDPTIPLKRKTLDN